MIENRLRQVAAWRLSQWVWALLALAGLGMHLGSAVLRLSVFLPYPRMVDFAAFYAGAWLLGQGLSPYQLSEPLLAQLRAQRQLDVTVSMFSSLAALAFLVWPLSRLSFPLAAWLWLALLLALLAWSARGLAALAGYRGWRAGLAVFALALTFGPTFLTLTLGQNSLFLLVACLALGEALRRDARVGVLGALSLVVSAAAKLYPLLWLAILPVLRAWRLLLLCLLVVVLLLGVTTLLTLEPSGAFWSSLLPGRAGEFYAGTSLDDQSLVAWLLRLGGPQRFTVPGLTGYERSEVVWAPPWDLPPALLYGLGYGLLALAGLGCLWLARRLHGAEREGLFYLWVLWLLLALPHMERYNHVLLLPALAWLWRRGWWRVCLAAYVLAGLARLTHAWLLYTPPLIGVLASGAGVCAVACLGAALACELRRASVSAKKVSLNLSGRPERERGSSNRA